MAEKKKQDEKLILGLGIAVAIGLIAWAVLGFLSLEEKFKPQTATQKQGKKVNTEERMEAAAELLNNPPVWNNSEIKGRPIELLTPIPLFLISGHSYLIDLYNEEGEPVHPPVPNKWWLEYKIDPSYKNSLVRDFDEDGFSNLEEFESKTDPTDPKAYPDLISKLSVEGNSLLKWKVYFSSDIGDDQYQFKYEDSKARRLRSDYIGKGARFFSKEPVVSRFILKKVIEKDQVKNGIVTKLKHAVIEDSLKGSTLEVPRGRKNDLLGKDYTVTFVLNALGKEGTSFTLPENTRFDLPDGKENPEGKFHFVGVKDDNSVVINFTKGEEISEISIPLK